MKKYQGILLKIHLWAFIALFLFFLLGTFTPYRLGPYLLYTFKIALLLSGIILFFQHLFPFKKRSLYFSYYVIGPFVSFIAWMMDGIMGAIVASVFFFWLIPPHVRMENENYYASNVSNGFLGAYEVTIYKKGILFDRQIMKGDYDDEVLGELMKRLK